MRTLNKPILLYLFGGLLQLLQPAKAAEKFLPPPLKFSLSPVHSGPRSAPEANQSTLSLSVPSPAFSPLRAARNAARGNLSQSFDGTFCPAIDLQTVDLQTLQEEHAAVLAEIATLDQERQALATELQARAKKSPAHKGTQKEIEIADEIQRLKEEEQGILNQQYAMKKTSIETYAKEEKEYKAELEKATVGLKQASDGHSVHMILMPAYKTQIKNAKAFLSALYKLKAESAKQTARLEEIKSQRASLEAELIQLSSPSLISEEENKGLSE